MIAVVLAGALLAGCSGGGESSVPTLELSTTTVTTAEPTTTAAPTTTVEETTTTVDPRIAEVEAAVAEFRRVQVELLLDPTRDLDQLSDVATGELLSNNIDFLLRQRAEGTLVAGEYEEQIREAVLVSDLEAEVVGCGRDALSATDSDGQVVDPPDVDAVLRLYKLSRASADESWRVSLVQYPGSEIEQCDL